MDTDACEMDAEADADAEVDAELCGAADDETRPAPAPALEAFWFCCARWLLRKPMRAEERSAGARDAVEAEVRAIEGDVVADEAAR